MGFPYGVGRASWTLGWPNHACYNILIPPKAGQDTSIETLAGRNRIGVDRTGDDVVVVEGKVSRDIQRENNKLSVDKILPIADYIDETFNKVNIVLKSKQINFTNLEKVLHSLKNDITENSEKNNTKKSLNICLNLDEVSATFEPLDDVFQYIGLWIISIILLLKVVRLN